MYSARQSLSSSAARQGYALRSFLAPCLGLAPSFGSFLSPSAPYSCGGYRAWLSTRHFDQAALRSAWSRDAAKATCPHTFRSQSLIVRPLVAFLHSWQSLVRPDGLTLPELTQSALVGRAGAAGRLQTRKRAYRPFSFAASAPTRCAPASALRLAAAGAIRLLAQSIFVKNSLLPASRSLRFGRLKKPSSRPIATALYFR